MVVGKCGPGSRDQSGPSKRDDHKRSSQLSLYNHGLQQPGRRAHRTAIPAVNKASTGVTQKHFCSDGHWQYPSALRESRYSDFVPCTYDEETILARLYQYALNFLSQSNISCRSSVQPSCNSISADIEMIASSPSPTPKSSSATSPRTRYFPRNHNGSDRNTVSKSPHPFVKPPSPAAFPLQRTRSPHVAPSPQKLPPLSPHKLPTGPVRRMVDAGTQYSPPLVPSITTIEPPKVRVKRKERSVSPEAAIILAEPPLAPLPSQTPATESSQLMQHSAASLATSISTESSSAQSSLSQASAKRKRRLMAEVKTMPAKYETCDVKDLVVLISNMLMELVRFNDEIPLRDGGLTRFHSRAPPTISVLDYLQRLTTHATLSPPILLSMVYYIDRLCALYPAFTISSLTVHRFLITSATVASKGLSDSFWTNNNYARVGGITLKELAILELEFLWRVEWRIVPKPEVLVDYYRSLIERSDGFEIESSEAVGIEPSDPS